jgi:hypothetical protein
MKSHLLAKIMGWGQFALTTLGQLATSGGLPHGPVGWITLAGSLLAAGGIHASANTDGTK